MRLQGKVAVVTGAYVTGMTIYADGGRLALNGIMARPQ